MTPAAGARHGAAQGRGGARMKISACVIVKNEEKHLPRWLDCVKRMAEELIVVDTG